jgi:hypothetical protein
MEKTSRGTTFIFGDSGVTMWNLEKKEEEGEGFSQPLSLKLGFQLTVFMYLYSSAFISQTSKIWSSSL